MKSQLCSVATRRTNLLTSSQLLSFSRIRSIIEATNLPYWPRPISVLSSGSHVAGSKYLRLMNPRLRPETVGSLRSRSRGLGCARSDMLVGWCVTDELRVLCDIGQLKRELCCLFMCFEECQLERMESDANAALMLRYTDLYSVIKK